MYGNNVTSLDELVTSVVTGFGQHDLTDRPGIFWQLTEVALNAPAEELESALWQLGNFLEYQSERIRQGRADRVYLAIYHARVQGVLDIVELRIAANEQQAAEREVNDTLRSVLNVLEEHDSGLTAVQIVGIINNRRRVSVVQVCDALVQAVDQDLAQRKEDASVYRYERLWQPARD